MTLTKDKLEHYRSDIISDKTLIEGVIQDMYIFVERCSVGGLSVNHCLDIATILQPEGTWWQLKPPIYNRVDMKMIIYHYDTHKG